MLNLLAIFQCMKLNTRISFKYEYVAMGEYCLAEACLSFDATLFKLRMVNLFFIAESLSHRRKSVEMRKQSKACMTI